MRRKGTKKVSPFSICVLPKLRSIQKLSNNQIYLFSDLRVGQKFNWFVYCDSIKQRRVQLFRDSFVFEHSNFDSVHIKFGIKICMYGPTHSLLSVSRKHTSITTKSQSSDSTAKSSLTRSKSKHG